jgi:hypothetical protein
VSTRTNIKKGDENKKLFFWHSHGNSGDDDVLIAWARLQIDGWRKSLEQYHIPQHVIDRVLKGLNLNLSISSDEPGRPSTQDVLLALVTKGGESISLPPHHLLKMHGRYPRGSVAESFINQYNVEVKYFIRHFEPLLNHLESVDKESKDSLTTCLHICSLAYSFADALRRVGETKLNRSNYDDVLKKMGIEHDVVDMFDLKGN